MFAQTFHLVIKSLKFIKKCDIWDEIGLKIIQKIPQSEKRLKKKSYFFWSIVLPWERPRKVYLVLKRALGIAIQA